MLHKGMEACHFSEHPKEMIGNRRARKVVDQPTEPGMLLHPLQETHNIFFRKMMGEERTDHKVNRSRRRVRKDIRANPLDFSRGRTGLGCNRRSVRIHVKASQFHGNAA
jgi:hypothetical protein